jgi:hypothetical protein
MDKSGDQNSKNCARTAEGSQGDEGTFWCNSEIIFTPNCHFPERHPFDPIVELLADQRSRVQSHVTVSMTAVRITINLRSECVYLAHLL